MKISKLILLLLLAFCMADITAQDAIPAGGGVASGDGGSVSYTLGQISYSIFTGSGGVISEGVQQPYEIFEITGVHTAPGITLHCIVFPNPVTDHVKLEVDHHPLAGLTYQLYNLQGRLLESRQVEGPVTLIPMSHLGSETYIIRITDHKEELKIFKIVKK